MSEKGEDVMELTALITALQHEVEKRRAVDDAATNLAQALGVEAHEQGLHAIEKTIRDISGDRLLAADRMRRFRSATPIPANESDSASDSEYGSGETSPSQSA
jgi:hypothetical protein